MNIIKLISIFCIFTSLHIKAEQSSPSSPTLSSTSRPIQTKSVKTNRVKISRDLIGKTDESYEIKSLKHLEGVLNGKDFKHNPKYFSTLHVGDYTITKYRQNYGSSSIPVEGGEFSIHFKKVNGNEYHSSNDRFASLSLDIDLAPRLTETEAAYIAYSDLRNCPNGMCINDIRSKLVILPESFIGNFRNGNEEHSQKKKEKETEDTTVDKEIESDLLRSFESKGKLSYKVEIDRLDGTKDQGIFIYYIDAKNGNHLFSYNDLRFAATGVTLFSGTVNMSSVANSGLFYLEDLNHTSTVLNCLGTNCNSSQRISDSDDIWSQDAAIDVHYGQAKVLDYFRNVHSRNSLFAAGGPTSVISVDNSTALFAHKVHQGTNITAAYWTGNEITYGDGDGEKYLPMVSLDIIAHEMTHVICQDTANFVAFGEPGALEESFGDVFAALVDRYVHGESANTWKFGEDVFTPNISGDAIRYMDNPHLAENKTGTGVIGDPDHYSEFVGTNSSSLYIHMNCGIPNKVFYLLSKGGTHPHGGAMTGIGCDAAAAIWYYALANHYLTSTSNFLEARTQTVRAARDLYGVGSFEQFQTSVAWGLCGVGDVPIVNTELILNGGIESVQEPWTLSGGSDAVFYIKKGGAADPAHLGKGFMKAGVNNDVNGVISQIINITGPGSPASLNLSFWLAITSADSNILMNDKLYVELKNPDTGAFIAQIALFSNTQATGSPIYYQRGPYNLISYVAGHPSLRLDFRVNTNNNLQTTFRLDDVSVSAVYYK